MVLRNPTIDWNVGLGSPIFRSLEMDFREPPASGKQFLPTSELRTTANFLFYVGAGLWKTKKGKKDPEIKIASHLRAFTGTAGRHPIVISICRPNRKRFHRTAATGDGVPLAAPTGTTTPMANRNDSGGAGNVRVRGFR